TGNHTGDDVIDLAFAQPAAARFLPAELLRFYVTDEPLSAPLLDALAEDWREHDFDLRWLAHRVFGSRWFHDPAHRGAQIKSPLHFVLGLLQEMELDLAPLPRPLLNSLRQMGQQPY